MKLEKPIDYIKHFVREDPPADKWPAPVRTALIVGASIGLWAVIYWLI